jgi:hypothetical protein
MSTTLSDILKTSNSFLDLEYALSSGTELITRTDFANQAVKDACSSYRFREFTQNYNVLASSASISLPNNFRELEEAPATEENGIFTSYPEIRPEERFTRDSDSNYCYKLGSPNGYTLVFNGVPANATLTIQYQRYPSGMATLTDICELPDAEYVKLKLISYVLQSRSDERFPIIDAEANNRLINMIGRSMIQPSGGLKRIPSNQTFRIGR